MFVHRIFCCLCEGLFYSTTRRKMFYFLKLRIFVWFICQQQHQEAPSGCYVEDKLTTAAGLLLEIDQSNVSKFSNRDIFCLNLVIFLRLLGTCRDDDSRTGRERGREEAKTDGQRHKNIFFSVLDSMMVGAMQDGTLKTRPLGVEAIGKSGCHLVEACQYLTSFFLVLYIIPVHFF